MAKQARIMDFEEARAASRSRTQSKGRSAARSRAQSYSRSTSPSGSNNRSRNSQSLGKNKTSSAKRNSQKIRSNNSQSLRSSNSRNGRNSQKLSRQSTTKSQAKAPKIKKHSPKVAPVLQHAVLGISSKISSISLGRKSTAAILACVCVLACFAFLYNPVKNYYTAVRDQAKAEAAYEIVSTRNDALIEDIALLTSEAGMEDRVREQYGWVKEGENAVIVSGLSNESEPTAAEILRTVTLNDIKAPETWYSPVLDPFFGYNNE